MGTAFAEQWGETPRRPVDFFDVKGDVESMLALRHAVHAFRWESGGSEWLHPGQSARVFRGERRVGSIGALHPDLVKTLDVGADVFVFELDLDPISERPLPSAVPVSRFPSLRRDISGRERPPPVGGDLPPLFLTWCSQGQNLYRAPKR